MHFCNLDTRDNSISLIKPCWAASIFEGECRPGEAGGNCGSGGGEDGGLFPAAGRRDGETGVFDEIVLGTGIDG